MQLVFISLAMAHSRKARPKDKFKGVTDPHAKPWRTLISKEWMVRGDGVAESRSRLFAFQRGPFKVR